MGMERVGVVGAGAWGTALAAAAASQAPRVILYARDASLAATINRRHENPRYLAGIALPPGLYATASFEEVAASDVVVVAVPAQQVRSVCERLAASGLSGAPVVLCAKGMERKSNLLMPLVVASSCPGAPVALLSGPTFAHEVARGQPAAAALACRDLGLARALSAALSTRSLRLYANDDVMGCALGGVVKNVLAVGSGIVLGRGLGENARAAFITRGRTEMARLGRALGARPETMSGLAGFGDLCLTCMSLSSRNTTLGWRLGRGGSLRKALSERRGVTEGLYAAPSVVALAKSHGVDMPLCESVYRILFRGADIDSVIADLLSRPLTVEA